MDQTDEQLLQGIAAGGARGRASLGELAGRYERPLVGLAAHLLGGRGDLARDVVQDAWLRVLRGARGFDRRASVRTWLYRIVINRCHDVRAKWQGAGLHQDLHQGLHHGQDQQRSTGGAVEAAGDGEHPHLARLRAAVAVLPETQGMVVLLFYHGGMTLPQAADILGIAEGTAKSRLHAALEALREKLVLPEGVR